MDEIDEMGVSIDEIAREAMLASLLQQHPGAVVEALDGDGRLVDLPASIELVGQQVVPTRSALDLVAAGSRAALLANWERAKLVGASMVPVVLVNGVDGSCYVVDVRHRHGTAPWRHGWRCSPRRAEAHACAPVTGVGTAHGSGWSSPTPTCWTRPRVAW